MTKSEIKALIERDKPMPMGKYYFQTAPFKDDPPTDTCGKCDKTVADAFTFCPWCGQRIDHDTYKL